MGSNSRLARGAMQVHRWIGLVVRVQILFWVFGGLVMTAIPLERVRGEHHLAPPQSPSLALVVSGALLLVSWLGRRGRCAARARS